MMDNLQRKKNLGKGLSALFGDEAADYQELDRIQPTRFLPLDQVVPSPFQPRKHFAAGELSELVESIKQRGVLQPILVRRSRSGNNLYELIAGERRWRASKEAGLIEIPAIIKDLSDVETLEIALIENLIRQDLNAVEEAEGYDRLMREFNYTQEQLAKSLNKSRSHIANSLRLLSLPERVRAHIVEGKLTAGHARAILRVMDQEDFAHKIINESMSVRAAERYAQVFQNKAKNKNQTEADPAALNLEESLSEALNMPVRIKGNGPEGSLTVFYKSFVELDDLISRLTKAWFEKE